MEIALLCTLGIVCAMFLVAIGHLAVKLDRLDQVLADHLALDDRYEPISEAEVDTR